jgi:transposase
MERRKFSREFKLEAVSLVRDRRVAVAQAARDLDVHDNVLRKWMRELGKDAKHAFPGHGHVKPEQQDRRTGCSRHCTQCVGPTVPCHNTQQQMDRRLHLYLNS